MLWLSLNRNNLAGERGWRKPLNNTTDSGDDHHQIDRRKDARFQDRGFLPVHLALLDHHSLGFLSHDAAVEPQLGSVDH